MFITDLDTKYWMEKLDLRLGVVTRKMFLISGFWAQRLGLEFLPRRERDCKLKSKESIMVVYVEYAKGYKLFDPSSHKTSI